MMNVVNKRRYEKIQHLGEGQFANVYKARDTTSGDIVAIKKIKIGNIREMQDGVDRSALREIKLLQEIDHENIINLRDVIGHKFTIQLVMDFMETDLQKVIGEQSVILTPSHIKNLVLQLMLGVEHLHTNFILHRDLKPNNLLINSAGRLKVTDFGLARYFGSPSCDYTHMVVTRWYRSPELLYAAKKYGTGVDIWAVGCIIGELLIRIALFPGSSDIDQMIKICTVLGIPTEKEWPGMESLPCYYKLRNITRTHTLQTVFTACSQDLHALIQSCLEFDPAKRCTATQALQMPYFTSEPFVAPDADVAAAIAKVTGGGEVRPARTRLRDMHDADAPPATRRRLEFA